MGGMQKERGDTETSLLYIHLSLRRKTSKTPERVRLSYERKKGGEPSGLVTEIYKSRGEERRRQSIETCSDLSYNYCEYEP